jgi:hypothetical protein
LPWFRSIPSWCGVVFLDQGSEIRSEDDNLHQRRSRDSLFGPAHGGHLSSNDTKGARSEIPRAVRRSRDSTTRDHRSLPSGSPSACFQSPACLAIESGDWRRSLAPCTRGPAHYTERAARSCLGVTAHDR